MRAIINPGIIQGQITAPPSKSMAQRAYAAALLHNGKTIIRNAGSSHDEIASLKVILQLGAKILSQSEGIIEIESKGIVPQSAVINCGESGLAARLFTPIAALTGKPITITGSGSLLKRPMEGFSAVCQALGIALTSFNGCLPATIQGPIENISIKVDASAGSQLLSGLLFALSYAPPVPITIEVTALKSKPYINMTLEILKAAGKPIVHDNYTTFYIDPALFIDIPVLDINIEGDWSGAANLLVAGAISGGIIINNLQRNSLQADNAIIKVLQQAGAIINSNEDSVEIQTSPLRSFEFDATHCPDLFPILAILASCCEGESYVHGVHRLFNKESNRAESISEMLQNFDIPFSLEDDSFCITGCKNLQGTIIDTYNDHRITMAAAVGALRANGPVDIINAEAVNKSYPGFFNDLLLCKVDCRQLDS